MENSPSCFYVIVKSFLKGLAVVVGLLAVSVGGLDFTMPMALVVVDDPPLPIMLMASSLVILPSFTHLNKKETSCFPAVPTRLTCFETHVKMQNDV